jgi:hypothetical protein
MTSRKRFRLALMLIAVVVIREFRMTSRKRFRLALMLIAVVVIAGAAGFHYIEGWPWFDGLYMTLITMTTVGYGETHPLSPAGKVFNSGCGDGGWLPGGYLLAGDARIRTLSLPGKATYGTRTGQNQRPLYCLWRRAGGPDRGPGITPAAHLLRNH